MDAFGIVAIALFLAFIFLAPMLVWFPADKFYQSSSV